MIVVSPYRPFPAESVEHHRLGAFDWVDALRMLAVSVRQSCQCDTFALTDVDTTLPVPSIHVETSERRLMLWILDVSLRYLESPHFTQDTVMVSPDTLVFKDLRPYFEGDLSVIVRPYFKYAKRPIINSVQWWPVASRKRLVMFYRRALALATRLPEPWLTWGADSEPIRQLVEPIAVGVHRRSGLDVHMLDMGDVMASLPTGATAMLDRGVAPGPPAVPILDFRYTRKLRMREYFDHVIGVPA